MPPRTPPLKNVRLGPPPKDDHLETLPMPGMDAPEPPKDQLVDPEIDDAQVEALALQLAAETVQADGGPRADGTGPDGAAPRSAGAAPNSDDDRDTESERMAREQGDEVAELTRRVDALTASLPTAVQAAVEPVKNSVAALTSMFSGVDARVRGLSAAQHDLAPRSAFEGLAKRVDDLVAGLDPALASRLAPLRAHLDEVTARLEALRTQVGGAASAEAVAQRMDALNAALEDAQRRLDAAERRNPDAADFNGRVQDVQERVDALVRGMRAKVQEWYEEWRLAASARSAPADEFLSATGERRWGAGRMVMSHPSATAAHADGAAPVVRFTVLGKGVQFLPVQNPDGSIGLRLNILAGAQYPMGELSLPRSGDGVREVDFGYSVSVPPGWLADVTCAAQQPDKPTPQQRAYITTLHGQAPPGQTLVLNLHCAAGARGVQSGCEVARLHLRRVEPAAFEVSDGVQTPQQAASRSQEVADKDAEIARLRALLESANGPLTGRFAEVPTEAAQAPHRQHPDAARRETRDAVPPRWIDPWAPSR